MNDDATFVYRRGQRLRLVGPLAVGLWGLTSTVLLLLAVGHEGLAQRDVSAVTLGLAVSVGAGVVGVAVAWRTTRMRVVITRTEVMVLGVWTPKTVPFAEIAGFELDRRGGVERSQTLVRLVAGPHGIPRSVRVGAMSAATGIPWLAATAVVLWVWLLGAFVPAGPWSNSMPWLIALGVLSQGGLTPSRRQARLIGEIGAVIEQMNAELDRRRGRAQSTAALLEAAHPEFRSIPYDD